MTESTSGQHPADHTVESAYREFLQRRARGESISFSAFKAEQKPELALGLEALHSAHGQAPGAGVASADVSFTDDFLLDAGWKLNQYEVVAPLGAGGFGEVYLAQQAKPRRRVALKVLRSALPSSEVLARFETECQALALMNHPYIAQVFDAGTSESGQPYVVMEYVDGEAITDHCRRHRLTIRGRLELFLRVCEAVQHAHEKGIVHRDLKPGNVLITTVDVDAPVPKVIDFGLVKAVGGALTDDAIVTQTGQPVGTPAYMAPEQLRGGKGAVDRRADVYSLGVLLYELLTGRRPFEFSRPFDLEEFVRVVLHEDPKTPSLLCCSQDQQDDFASERRTDPRSLSRQLRGELDWIVLKSLEKDRTRRYSSVSELSCDIAAYLSGEAVVAGPPALSYRCRKFIVRHRFAAALLAVGVAVVLLGAGVFAVARERELARLDAEVRSLLRSANEAVVSGAVSGAMTSDDDSSGDASESQLAAAEAKLAALRERSPRRESVVELQSLYAATLLAKAAKELERYNVTRANERRHEDAWRTARRRRAAAGRAWEPIWRRQAEATAWRRWRAAHQQKDVHLNAALFTHERAALSAPVGSQVQVRVEDELREIYTQLYRDASAQGGVFRPREFYASMAQNYAGSVAGPQRVRIVTEPPGAALFCFRYEEHPEELRWVPRPFQPLDPSRDGSDAADVSAAAGGTPGLTVRRVEDSGRTPFQRGDRVVRIGTTAVESLTQLAAVLLAVDVDASVDVEVVRQQSKVEIIWTPFSTEAVARTRRHGFDEQDARTLVQPWVQFGVEFAAYPIVCSAVNRLGATQGAAVSEVTLPPGNYLFVAQHPGYVDARLPVSIPADEEPTLSLNLLRSDQIPAGFVHLPAGRVATGGDRDAFQSLAYGEFDLPACFFSRYEVSNQEWLEFLNDPAVAPRIDRGGMMRPTSKSVLEDLARRGREGVRIPAFHKTQAVWNDATRRWEWNAAIESGWPALGICHYAAEEYAAWRTQRSGGRWRFRLPTDLEWERAARGVDRRTYVWGSFSIPSFCVSGLGLPRPHGASGARPQWLGFASFDESVFGVRDLAGSVSEHTTGRPREDSNLFVYRGGSWGTVEDDWFFRASSRNSMLPERTNGYLGVRLVAEATTEDR